MFEIETTGRGTVTVVVRGPLDLLRAPRLRATITALLNRGDVTDIDLDIAGVTSADASGLGTVIVAHRVAAAVGVDLRLAAVSPLAARLLPLLGAQDLVPVPAAMAR